MASGFNLASELETLSINKSSDQLAFRYPFCVCWVKKSAYAPECMTDCLFQTDWEYYSTCQCISNSCKNLRRVDCEVCALDFHCKAVVTKVLSEKCLCIRARGSLTAKWGRPAKSCLKCIERVRELLKPYYPACPCKSGVYESQDLYNCEVYCPWGLGAVYKHWFENERRPILFIWNRDHTYV
jgi:hypothetical protein